MSWGFDNFCIIFFFYRSEEGREINHHGRPVKTDDDDSDDKSNKVGNTLYIPNNKTDDKVTPLTPVSVDERGIGGSIKLISRNEKTQVQALRDHYQKYCMIRNLTTEYHNMYQA